MNLEPLARWLGPRYVVLNGAVYDGDTAYRLDDDQLLGAILRRAAETDAQVTMQNCFGTPPGEGEDWLFSLEFDADGFDGRGPTPLSAALAAVEELTKEKT